jgi:GNAT superfamily N-acetyltransferase
VGHERTDREPEFAVNLCGPADRAEQAQLFNACFKKSATADLLSWRYDRGPHGPAISLVTRVDRGAAVSGYACSPRLVLAHGDERSLARVGETGDVMTHPDWRKRGLFSALDRAALLEAAGRGWPVVFGLPNRRSAHIFVELGWKAVGAVRTWTFLFAADAVAREVRRREGRWRGFWTGLGVSACARARRRASGLAASVEARKLERFPAEVAALSRVVAARHAWMVRRDAEYLNWRFVDNHSRAHEVVGLFAGERFVGYAVVQKPEPGRGIGYLVDVLGEERLVEIAAVEAGLASLQASGASVAQATAIDGSWWSERLRSSGFLPPRAGNHLIVIVNVLDSKHPVAQAAMDPTRWYLTDGDRDDETMG